MSSFKLHINFRLFSAMLRTNLRTQVPLQSNSSQSSINNRQLLDNFIFSNITNILETNPISNQTQLSLEKFVFNQFSSFIKNKEGGNPRVFDIDTKILNPEFRRFIFEKYDIIVLYFDKRKDDLNTFFIDNNFVLRKLKLVITLYIVKIIF